jgi:hypothetical protein
MIEFLIFDSTLSRKNMELSLYLGSCLISAVFCAWHAKKNQDSMGEWLVLGLLYPPFVSIPAVIFCARPVRD